MSFADELRDLGVSTEFVEWVGDRTADQAWAECERGDWMAELLAKTVATERESPERRRLALTTCRFARLALPYAKGPVALTTVEAVESWARGDGATLEDVRTAYAAAASDASYAYAAASAAHGSAASAAAHASAYAAAAAAHASAYAAPYAADAAAQSAAFAADAAYAAWQNLLRQCADIVREDWPVCPIGADQRLERP